MPNEEIQAAEALKRLAAVSASPANEESLSTAQPLPNQNAVQVDIEDELGYADNSKVPKLPYLKLFWFFFDNFGCFAWSGPVAQIALLKERLVIQDQWITLARFQRVFAVYQILPGPEAAELCIFFGCLSAGRIGGVLAGLAFILPGFTLMLLASYLYTLAGFKNEYFNASFKALQPVVAAMILRAIHKLADHSFVDQATKKINPFLVIIALCTFLNCALRINIFISLAFYGLLFTLITARLWILSGIMFVLQYVGFAIYVNFKGIPAPVQLAIGIAPTPTLANLFLLGLVGGSLSFGGAYTAIPFIQVEAVLKGGWLGPGVFLNSIAIGNVLPAPIIIFATFVGFQGGLAQGVLMTAFGGAIVITLGMFLPCFIITIIGHHLLEQLVKNKILAAFFDGLCASVIGVVAVIGCQMLRVSIVGSENPNDTASDNIDRALQSGPAAVLCILALAVLYKSTTKWTPLILVAIGATAGQFLFISTLG